MSVNLSIKFLFSYKKLTVFLLFIVAFFLFIRINYYIDYIKRARIMFNDEKLNYYKPIMY